MVTPSSLDMASDWGTSMVGTDENVNSRKRGRLDLSGRMMNVIEKWRRERRMMDWVMSGRDWMEVMVDVRFSMMGVISVMVADSLLMVASMLFLS